VSASSVASTGDDDAAVDLEEEEQIALEEEGDIEWEEANEGRDLLSDEVMCVCVCSSGWYILKWVNRAMM